VLAAIFIFGTDVNLAREAAKNPSFPLGLSVISIVLALGLGGVAILAGYITLPAILGESKAYLLEYSWFALALIPFSLLNVYMTSLLLGAGRYDAYNMSRLVFYPIYTMALIGIALMSELTIPMCVAAFLGSAVIAPLVNTYIYVRHNYQHQRGATLPSIGGLLIGSRGNAVSFMLAALYAHLPLFLLTKFGSSDGIGFFVVASSMAAGVTAFSGVASKVFFSESSRVEANGDLISVIPKFRKTVVITVAIVCLLQLMTPILLPLVFGTAFSAAWPIAFMLLFAVGLSGLSSVIDDSLKGRGAPGPGICSRLVYVVTVALCAVPVAGNMPEYRLPYIMVLAGILELAIISRALALRLDIRVVDIMIPTLKEYNEVKDSLIQLLRSRS
jgi:O-antigen/teichoic acid export membrane protein